MQITLDHAQRSSWQGCKREYLFRHICGTRKAVADTASFSFGSAFHKSTELIDLGESVDSAMLNFTEMFNFPDDKVRTLSRARDLLTNYQIYIQKKGWKFQIQSKGTMEISFQKPLTERITYAGRCDRKFDNGEIGEWKTTYYLYNSSGNSLPYLSQWWGHNSIRGYAWANDATAVTILGAGVFPQRPDRKSDPYPCIDSLRIPVLTWEIEQFICEMKMIGEEIITYRENSGLLPTNSFEENVELLFKGALWRSFPTNTSKCYYTLNNPCQFIDLCTRNVPKSMWTANYILDPFQPWLEDKEE